MNDRERWHEQQRVAEALEAQADRLVVQADELRGEATRIRALAGPRPYVQIRLEDARDLALDLEEFTASEFARELAERHGISEASGRNWLTRLVEAGLARVENEIDGTYRGGREAGPDRPRDRRPPPHVEAVQSAPRPSRSRKARKKAAKRPKVRNKEMDALVKRAHNTEGWSVEITGNNHIKFTAPSGQPIYQPKTPSDHRSVDNAKADLRREGLDV